MTIRSLARCLLIAGGLSITAAEVLAQQPSGGRRTDFEYLEKGFDLDQMTPPGYPKSMDTPELRAKYEQAQLKRFQQNTEKLATLGQADWVAQYDSASDRSARRKFEDMAKDLEKVSDDMIQFFEWRFEVKPVEPGDTSPESVRDRVAKIKPMVEQITGTISILAGGGIPAKEFAEMRENLARLHLLSRSLRK
jgi:hypothetical protein